MADIKTVNATPMMPPVRNASTPTPPAPTARPAAPTIKGDDYAKPGVLGTATTIHAIGKAVGGGTGATSGGVVGVWAALKAGVKANALMAGAVSLVTNGYDLIKGRENLKQFLGLTAADGVAYTAIGVGSTMAAAALTPLVVGAFPAIAGLATVLTVGTAGVLGIVGSMLYGKVGHETLKDALR